MTDPYETRPWDRHWGAAAARPEPAGWPTVLDAFADAVATGPDRPFLSYFDVTLSLRDVDDAADALAVELQESGVVAGDRVALYLQNQPEFVLGCLAAWRCGAVVVPVNPMLRERELTQELCDSGSTVLVLLEELWHDVARHVLADTAVQTVLTTSGLAWLGSAPVPAVLAEVRRQPVPTGQDVHAVVERRAGQRPRPVAVSPDDTAFLGYTSGTTGPPKGALLTHGGVLFSAHNYRTMRSLDEDDVVFALAPLFHVTGLICSVAIGMLVPVHVVLGYRYDAAQTLALVERHRVTFTVGAITAFLALLDHPDRTRYDLSSLTKVISGGAAIPPSVVERYEAATGVYIHNGYGLTETTSPTFGTPVGSRSPVDPRSGALALGIPLPGTDCRLVDDDGQPVAIGEPGEIVVRGPHVVPGYWGRPEETAHALRDGWLLTGDVATMDADGWFYLLDRKKDQINAAGYKVWPREVEDVLVEHPAVREAAVVGVPDAYRGETVKAFVSLRDGMTVTPEELIAFARERLAAYKYPRQVELLDELPKTITGKVLRRQLRDRPAAAPTPGPIPATDGATT